MDEIGDKLKEIDEIDEREKLTPLQLSILFAFISAVFAVFFGGSLKDAMASAIVGVFLSGMERLWGRNSVNRFMAALFSSFLGGLMAIGLVYIGLGDSVSKINIGNIMLLIPGMALTNSMRDMFSGDTISGTLRFVESALLAMTLAVGFVLANKFGGIL